MLKELKVALFDLDGTIIDTEPYHYKCWNDILLHFGHRLDYDHYLSTFAGVSIDQNCQRLIESYGLNASVGSLKNKKEELMISCLLDQPLSVMSFVEDIIDYLTFNKIRLGLVTSSSQAETKIILNKLQLEKTFDFIVTRDDVVNKKPHPEPYMLAKTFFACPDEHFLVFEDSLSGVQSAKRAKLRCLAVQKNVSQNDPIRLFADGVFQDFNELRLSLILKTA